MYIFYMFVYYIKYFNVKSKIGDMYKPVSHTKRSFGYFHSKRDMEQFDKKKFCLWKM
jgi:hypothetical protein